MPITNNLGQTKVGVRTGVLAQQVSYLLDTYSGAAAAYSLRKLNGSYTGSAIRVRRSNDNTTLDVGFDANGNLDTTSMLNFIGGQNLYLPSEDLSGFNWGGNGVNRTSNTGVAPDGITPANLLSEQSTLNNHNLSYSVGLSITAGKAVNHSVYLKKGPGSNAPDIISLYVGNATFNMRAVFNISTGQLLNTTTGNATGFEALITDAGNGWWRCSIGGTLPHTTTQNFLLLTEFCNNVNSTTRQFYLGNVNANVYVWGLQYSNTNSVQPYSKTTTTTAGNGFVSIWYDQSENGYNLIQNTAANQARIVLNGVLETLNGKPALVSKFNSANNAHYNVTYNSTVTSPYTVFHIGSNVGSAAATYLFDSISVNPRMYSTSYNTTWLRIGGTLGGPSEFALTGYTQVITTQRIINAIYNGASSKLSINNGSYTQGDTKTSGANGLTLGASYANTLHATAYYQEHILYPSNQESNVNNIDNNINSYYSIY